MFPLTNSWCLAVHGTVLFTCIISARIFQVSLGFFCWLAPLAVLAGHIGLIPGIPRTSDRGWIIAKEWPTTLGQSIADPYSLNPDRSFFVKGSGARSNVLMSNHGTVCCTVKKVKYFFKNCSVFIFGLLEFKLQEKPLTLQKLNLFTFFLFNRYHNFFYFPDPIQSGSNSDSVPVPKPCSGPLKTCQKNVFLDLLDVLIRCGLHSELCWYQLILYFYVYLAYIFNFWSVSGPGLFFNLRNPTQKQGFCCSIRIWIQTFPVPISDCSSTVHLAPYFFAFLRVPPPHIPFFSRPLFVCKFSRQAEATITEEFYSDVSAPLWIVCCLIL